VKFILFQNYDASLNNDSGDRSMVNE